MTYYEYVTIGGAVFYANLVVTNVVYKVAEQAGRDAAEAERAIAALARSDGKLSCSNCGGVRWYQSAYVIGVPSVVRLGCAQCYKSCIHVRVEEV